MNGVNFMLNKLDVNSKLHKFNLTTPEGHSIIRMKWGGIVTKNVKWIFIQYVGESISNGYEEYISEDGSLCKQIWDDGYIEIFKIAK